MADEDCTAGAHSALAAVRLQEMGWRDVATAGREIWECAGDAFEQGGREQGVER